MEQAKASNDSIEASGAGPAEAPSMAAAGSDVRAAGEPAAAAAPAGAGAASEVAAGPRHALTSGAAGKFRVVRTREQFMEVRQGSACVTREAGGEAQPRRDSSAGRAARPCTLLGRQATLPSAASLLGPSPLQVWTAFMQSRGLDTSVGTQRTSPGYS